jgi:hypothetical protein
MIQNKCINIKKIYKINSSLIDNTEVIIKNYNCKNRNNNGKLCLNKCIEGSKCCRVHDPIMRNNRKKMNLWRREIKKYNEINYESYYKYKEVEDNKLSYGPEYHEITIEPSTPLIEDIIDAPEYIKKSDKCGETIINHTNNNLKINTEIIENNNITNYKSISVKQLYEPKDKSELTNRFNDSLCKQVIDNKLIDYIHDYNFTIMKKPIDEYLDDLNKINYKELQIKGIKSHKIINELIAINISSYYKAYNKIPSTNFFYKYANTISSIISKIPK